MKRAAEALATHPYRVHDAASAQRVKGCGPVIAQVCVGGVAGVEQCNALDTKGVVAAELQGHGRLRAHLLLPSPLCPLRLHPARPCLPRGSRQLIVSVLFALYPPELPGEEELEEVRRQEAALRAAAAAQRKRKKDEAAAGAALGAGAGGGAGHGVATQAMAAAAAAAGGGRYLGNGIGGGGRGGGDDDDEEEAEEEGGGKRGRRGGGGAAAEYIPRLHSAPFAFLVCMLQVSDGGGGCGDCQRWWASEGTACELLLCGCFTVCLLPASTPCLEPSSPPSPVAGPEGSGQAGPPQQEGSDAAD